MMNDLYLMDRRALIQRVALLIGATAVPAEIFAAKSKSTGSRFLNKTQFALLTAVADTIIPATDTPGAVAADVPRLFEMLLANWASAKRRQQLESALAEIDALALKHNNIHFVALPPAHRKVLLVEHDMAALKPGPVPKERLNSLEAMMAGPPIANPAFLKLKELVIALYYMSEIALTKELIYEHVPGQWVPSMKITPETRPFSSGGPF